MSVYTETANIKPRINVFKLHFSNNFSNKTTQTMFIKHIIIK